MYRLIARATGAPLLWLIFGDEAEELHPCGCSCSSALPSEQSDMVPPTH